MVAVAAAKPGYFLSSAPALETHTAFVGGETTIESHGNSVVHGSAPVFAAPAAPLVETRAAVLPTVAKTAYLTESKTIESHGNSVVHSAAPVVTGYAAPAVHTYAAPAVHAYAAPAYAAAGPIAYAAHPYPAHYVY